MCACVCECVRACVCVFVYAYLRVSACACVCVHVSLWPCAVLHHRNISFPHHLKPMLSSVQSRATDKDLLSRTVKDEGEFRLGRPPVVLSVALQRQRDLVCVCVLTCSWV